MTTAKNDVSIGFGLQLENFYLVGGARGKNDFLVGKNKNLVGGGTFSM